MHPVWAVLPGWVLGVALQLQQAQLWPPTIYLGMTAAAVAWALVVAWAGRKRRGWGVAAALLAGVLGAAGSTGLRAVHFQAQGLVPELEGVDLVVTGQIDSLPQRGADSDRFELAVQSATREGRPVTLPPRLLISHFRGQGAGRPWRAGDHWRLTVRLRRPHGVANPHGFDRERWLWEHGIGATGYLRDGPRDAPPVRLGSGGPLGVEATRQRVAERIDARVSDPRSAGVIAALVVGDQAAIERDDWRLFRNTGVAHLMSISGLHVTVFAWLATGVVAWGWRRLARLWPGLLLAVAAPRAAGWGGVLCAGAYAVFSGWGVPAQRTVLMLAIVVALGLGVRRWPWPAVWTLAMVAVLLLDPWALMQPGFWLSFVAVGILFSAGRREARSAPSGPDAASGWRRAGQAAWALLREQSVMTVALAPLGLLLFGQISVIGLVANLLAIPWVTLVVTPLSMLGVAFAPLWTLAAGSVQALVAVLGWMGGPGWSSLNVAIPPWPLAALAAVGAAWLTLRWPWSLRLAGGVLMAPMLVWSPTRPAAGEFEVTAIDVGQGSAILVRTAEHSLLYDTGPRYGPGSDAGDRVVVPLLRALGEAPDTVVVSHRDSDHAGGSAAVRAAWPSARWLSSFGDGERCLAGQRWHWDGVDFELLHPAPEHFGPEGEGRLSSNAMSCVLRVGNGRRWAWLSGDLDAERETRLALAQPTLRADLLVAPHHGSATSSSPVLLNTLRPSVAMIQSGYRNRFGHPAPVVIERFRERRMHWWSSPQCGAATWRSDQPYVVRCHRDSARRYWHHQGAPDPTERDPPLAEP